MSGWELPCISERHVPERTQDDTMAQATVQQQGRRTGWRSVAVCLLLGCATLAQGDGPRLGMAGGDEAHRARFTDALETALQARGLPAPVWQGGRRSELLIALGDDAFRDALTRQRPVVGVFVSRTVALEAYTAGCVCTAFFSEADPARQLHLARLMFPGARRVGLFTGPDSAWAAGLLQAGIADDDWVLVHETARDAADLTRRLPRLLAQVDVLLAVSDPALYNADNARTLLLTSYRQGRPVIGPDDFMVQAGGVATTYSSGLDQVEDVADLLARLQARGSLQGRLPPPDFGRHFSVRVNAHVARSYDVPLVDPAALGRQLEAWQ